MNTNEEYINESSTASQCAAIKEFMEVNMNNFIIGSNPYPNKRRLTMSKIAEEKALEAYPEDLRVLPFAINPQDININKRTYYGIGYDQAIQDFLDKAERWLEPTFKNLAGYNSGGDLMNDFKNYMQDEM